MLAPERPYATIDDERWEFRLRQEFGAAEDREFARYSREYDQLWASERKLNREQGKRIDWLLDWLLDHVLVDPKALRDRLGELLTGNIKREIVLTFSNAPQLMAILEEAAARAADQKTETDTEPEASLSTSES